MCAKNLKLNCSPVKKGANDLPILLPLSVGGGSKMGQNFSFGFLERGL